MLFVNGQQSAETVTDSSGLFTFTNVTTSEIAQTIYVKASDSEGNVSEPSKEYSIYRDNVPPEIEVTSPNNGDNIKSNSRSLVVKGKTEGNSKVSINNQYALVTQEGEFSSLVRLEEGKNKIEIKATDKAGNETTAELNVNFEKTD